MKLLEGLRDARMRRRVARMDAPTMMSWFSNEILGETAAWKEFERSRSPHALDEVEARLRAKAALTEGLRRQLKAQRL